MVPTYSNRVGPIIVRLLLLLPPFLPCSCNDPPKTCSGDIVIGGVSMSMAMEGQIKRWTAKRKSALVLDTIQGKTTVAEANRPRICHLLRSRSGSMRVRRAWRM
jgi:hypothetical protein